MRQRARASGAILYEVVLAITLAVILVGTIAAQVVDQTKGLRAAQDEARARSALLDVHERLRGGLLPLPGPGQARSIAGADGLTVTVQRETRAVEQRLTAKGALVPVLLTVRWKGAGGPAERRISALVPGGAP